MFRSAGILYRDEPLFVHKHLMELTDGEWVRKHTLHNYVVWFKSRQKFRGSMEGQGRVIWNGLARWIMGLVKDTPL